MSQKYVGCYIAQNRNGWFKKIPRNDRSPVEHLFDNHTFCGSTWCRRKEIEDTVEDIMKQKLDQKVRFHISQNREYELY